MLKNAYLDAKIGVDPAENEPRKECRVVAASGIAPPLGALLERSRSSCQDEALVAKLLDALEETPADLVCPRDLKKFDRRGIE